jgi:hypothetical protein
MQNVTLRKLAGYVIAGMTKTEVFNELKINPGSDYVPGNRNFRNIKIINKFFSITESIENTKTRYPDIELNYNQYPFQKKGMKYSRSEIIEVIKLLNEAKKQAGELKA